MPALLSILMQAGAAALSTLALSSTNISQTDQIAASLKLIPSVGAGNDRA